MRVVIQRVNRASVSIDGIIKSEIGEGLMILVGVEDTDTEEDIKWLAGKISRLRIFRDDEGAMNRSLTEIGGDILCVSQFTLHAKTKKGNRPSFIHAAKPDIAIPIYEKFVKQLSAEIGKQVKTGKFGAHMQIDLLNDGPVTIFIDTKNKE
jgi:D-tyrosyl-tRNA(Tyr) deacylase